MVFRLSRLGIPQRADPNGWQSLDRYRTIQDIQLEQNTFVVRHRDTIDFSFDAVTGDLMMRGMVYCQKDVVLRVDKWFECDADRSPTRVRCFRFAYIGWQTGGNPLLKYHNLHADPDEYVHRVYNPATGKQILYETLQRYQFPTFSEVLDELEYLAESL